MNKKAWERRKFVRQEIVERIFGVEEVSDLGDTIREAMYKVNMSPVEFEKPLKNVTGTYKFIKRIKPKNIVCRHHAVGWGLGLGRGFGVVEKALFDVEKLLIENKKDEVYIELILRINIFTFREDCMARLDEFAELLKGDEWQSIGYSYYAPPTWAWDTVERIGDVSGFTQMRGDGIPTGTLEEEE